MANKIDHLDLATKHVYLAAGVREYHPVGDVYKELRTLRATNPSLRGFDTPVFASGNVAKGGGKFTPRLATFRYGWKIVPEDVSHTLHVTGEQITDGGEAGPACFDLEPISATSKIIIQYEPPLAEIIETTVSGLTEEESSKLIEIHTVAEDIPVQFGEVQFQQALLNEIAEIIKKVEFGRWKIDKDTNQMMFYEKVEEEWIPLATFDLKDKEGLPAHENVYERIPV